MSKQSKTPRFRPSLADPCYVVAGTVSEYRAWLHKNDHEPLHYAYVYNTSTLIGLDQIHGVFIGTWRERKDIEAIKERITIIKSRSTIAPTTRHDVDQLIADAATKKPTRTLEELQEYIDEYVESHRVDTDRDNSRFE